MHDAEILLTLKRQQQLFVDPRRINLLKQIAQTGSLSQAAKQLGISYKTAWDAMHALNQLAPKPMIVSTTGGKGGGGASLTAYGARFVQLYDLLLAIEYRAFQRLSEDDSLDNLLAATARLSLQTSARNQLYATIESIDQQAESGAVTVTLADEMTQLSVSITQASIARLGLQPQQAVMLLFKAPAVTLIKLPSESVINQLNVTLLSYQQLQSQYELVCVTQGGTQICASLPATEAASIAQPGATLTIAIQPQNIIIAALV